MNSFARSVIGVAGIVSVCLLAPGPSLAQPAAEGDLDPMARQRIDDAKTLAASSLPKIELLGADWKRAWELPPGLAASAKSEDEFWARCARDMGSAGMKQEEAATFIDQMLQQIASAPGMTPRDGLIAMMNLTQSSNAPSAQKQCDAYESAARTFATVAQQVMGGETKEQTSDKSQRRILDMAGAPYKSLDDAALREALLKAMTLIQRRTYMEYYRSNNWSAVTQAKDVDAAVKAGAWIGVVKLNLMLADESRVAEVMDLRPEDAPKLGPRLNSAMKAIVTSMTAIERKRLDDRYAQRASNPAAQALGNKDLDEQRQKLDEQLAHLAKFNVTVAPKQFGDNSYVIRIDGVSPDQLNLPLGMYTGWIRKGQAMVEISLAGNFPTEEMTKEMDHFLSEMDAKLASYDSSLAGAFNIAQPADLGPSVVAGASPVAPKVGGARDPSNPGGTEKAGGVVEKPPQPPGDQGISPPTKADDPAIQAQLAKGNQSYGNGDVKGAKEQFDEILQVDPGNVQALTMRAACNYFLNDLEAGVADYTAVAKADPTNAKVRRYLALGQMLTGKAKQAKAEIDSQLAQSPSDPELLLLRAQVAIALHNNDEAKQWHAKAVAADPTLAARIFQSAADSLSRGMLAVAIMQFNSVIQLDPAMYQAWYGLAQAEAAQGRYEDAINAYKTYLRSDSTSQWGLNAKAEIERLENLDE